MKNSRKRYRIFYKLEEHLEIPMFILAMAWLYLFLVELISGLSQTQETIILVIWILFIVEFLIKLVVAPRKLRYIRNSWITIIALIIPALRVFRIFNALRLLRSVRVINSTRVIRAITSGKRFFGALKEAQGPRPDPTMEVGIMIVFSKDGNQKALLDYAGQMVEDVKKELEESTGIEWKFDITEPSRLDNDLTKRPSDFLDKASLIMSEGPYDLVTVITDVGLMSRRNYMEPALSSKVARIIVLSTRQLTITGRNKTNLDLQETTVRFNTAVLFLHQIGHILGLRDTSLASSKIMGADSYTREIRKIPSYSMEERKILLKRTKKAPDRELRNGNDLETLIFHILMTLRHFGDFFKTFLRNGSIFLPLSLPGLATAAVAPAIILIFSAEIWDVGLGMTNGTAVFFAVISIMLASFYLVRVQSLFLPRKEKRILTEHLAVTNSVIYFSIFFACIGLFILVGALSLIIMIYVFPEDLMRTWPTLSRPEIAFIDKVRIAVFISTIGVTTGALAGGLESKALIQHLALFRKTV